MLDPSERAAQTEPIVSVVVVNFNGEEFILTCLASVLEQETPLEIIVVDNGSTDNSVDVIRASFPKVKLIQNDKNLGFAGPANQGADLASGELLLFLNNDARLVPGTLARLVSALRAAPNTAACEPTMLRNDGKLDSAGSMLTRTGFLYHLSESDLSSARYGLYRFSLKGACLLVRADLFHRAGRFDESYFAYFEETDLCWRLLAMGYQLEHVSDTLVIHDVGRTTTAIFPSSHIDYLSFRNRITTIRKNGDASFKLRVLPVHVACCLGVGFAFAMSGKYKNAIGVLRAVAWHLRPSGRLPRQLNRPRQPTTMGLLAPVTVRLRLSAATRMLKVYLVRW